MIVILVKKDDPPLELPSLPQSFSEAWDLVSGANKLKSVSEFPPPTEEEVIMNELIEQTELQIDIDPFVIISQAHEEAIHEKCHCPVGVCLNPHDETASPVNPSYDVPTNPDSVPVEV